MSNSSQLVHVDLGDRAYDIHIGQELLETLPAQVAEHCQIRHAAVITDTHVEPLYGTSVCNALNQNGVDAHLFTVPAGEPSKSIDQANQLWQQVLAAGADRQTVVLAVGGGVVGDLAGFVAATFGRGVPFVQVPTSLLAQVDSSVGGKVGINLPGAKNMVGAFWQPRYVLIDTKVLDTLPERELSAGLAEVVKYGVIMDAELFDYLAEHSSHILARDHQSLTHIVARACRLKADVVEADEREESGRRAILNYGHTFAHAIEAVSGYGKLLHGEAVAIGMLCASRLAVSLGMIPAEITARQHQLLSTFNLPTAVPADLDHNALIDAMQHDKKVEHGKLRYVLPTKMGHVDLFADIPVDKVRAALQSQ